jgi:WD40 repeat protein
MTVDRGHGFRASYAVVVGIDAYHDGMAELRNARADATAVTARLERQGYRVLTLLDGDATGTAILGRLEELTKRAEEADRAMFYFAGHGIALDGDDRPEGYLVPSGARLGDVGSYVAMSALHERLLALRCRHFLAVLDCCFAGSFRWSAARNVLPPAATLYRERFYRFVNRAAWQVITSAASDQRALDVSRDHRGTTPNSPFARALLDVLDGAVPELAGTLVTATRLYSYLRDAVEQDAASQTPTLSWFATRHRDGEYIFQPAAVDVELAPAPPLTNERNPYRGLDSFEHAHAKLFFGRAAATEALAAFVAAQPITIVVAASGAGKSSVVKAGLAPHLEAAGWRLTPVVKPGASPIEALTNALEGEGTPFERLAAWLDAHGEDRLLLVVDQLEELATLCRDEATRIAFVALLHALAERGGDRLRIVVTLRADYEPFVRARWTADSLPRFVLQRMRPDELREAIVRPAEAEALFFEDELVDEIVNAVDGQPEVLPLVSHLLQQLYKACATVDNTGRVLSRAAYDALGGVAGSIATAASRVRDELVAEDPRLATTLRNVMMRMIDTSRGSLARRRVLVADLAFPDPDENRRVDRALACLTAARLVTFSADGTHTFVEPAHDALLRHWEQIATWNEEVRATTQLASDLSAAAHAWQRGDSTDDLAWTRDPRLLALPPLHASQGWMNALETRFAARSLTLRTQRRRRVTAIVAAVMTGLSVLSIVAWLQRDRAIEQTARAEANQRVAETNEQLAKDNAAQAERRRRAELARTASLIAQSDTSTCPALAAALAALIGDDGALAAPTTPQATRALFDGLAAGWCPRVDLAHADKENRGLDILGFQRAGAFVATTSQIDAGVWRADDGAIVGNLWAGDGESFEGTGVSPDGTRAVTFFRHEARGTPITAPRLWDVRSTTVIANLEGHEQWVTAALFTLDGSSVITADRAGTARVWDAATGRPLRTLTAPPPSSGVSSPTVLQLARDGTRLLATNADCIATVYDVATWEVVARIDTRSNIRGAVLSRDATLLLSRSGFGVQIWNVQARTLLASVDADDLTALALDPDSRVFVTGTVDGAVRVYRIEGARYLTDLSGHRGAIRAIACSARCARVLTGSDDETVRLWDRIARAPIAVMRPGGWVRRVEISEAGDELATAAGWRATVWRAPEMSRVIVLDESADDVERSPIDADLSPDGARVLLKAGDDTRLVDAYTGAVLATFASLRYQQPRFSADARWLVLAGDDHLSIRTAADGSERFRLHLPTRLALSAEIAASGRRLAIPNAEYSGVVVVDPATGDMYPIGVDPVPADADEPPRLIDKPRFDATGAWMVTRSYLKPSGSIDGVYPMTISLWSTEVLPPTLVRELPTRQGVMSPATMPLDGERWIASGIPAITPYIVSAVTGERLADLVGHTSAVHAIEVAPGGQRIATRSGDRTARLWDRDGTSIAMLGGHEGPISGLSFSSDGSRLVTTDGRTNRVWGAADGAEVAALPATGDDRVMLSPDGHRMSRLRRDAELRLVETTVIEPARLIELGCAAVAASVPSDDANEAAVRTACARPR